MKIKDLVGKHGDLELSEEVLKQLGIEVKVDRFEMPEKEELYYFITSSAQTGARKYESDLFDEIKISTGNYYLVQHFTREEVEEIARQKLEYDVAVWELKREIARLNDGWVPNWNDEYEQKYTVYNARDKFGYNFWYTVKYMPNWVYLKSDYLCYELIRTHEKQLKIYLEIE